MTGKPEDIDEYLGGLPPAQRMLLMQVRRIIRASVPEAAESISYGLPTYKYLNKALVYFGAAKNHWAIYGLVPAESRDRLAGYDVSKGTIRFRWDEPVPEALVKRLMADRRAKIEASGAARSV